MDYWDIVDALTILGLATPREILDFLGMHIPVDENSDISEIQCILSKENVSYYTAEEWFARRRYTLSMKPYNKNIKPRVFFWPLPPQRLDMLARECRRKREIKRIGDHVPTMELCPDHDRATVFCVESGRNLDGVIDLRKPLAKRFRFPTILYNTYRRNGMSEWKRACRIYSSSSRAKRPLRIRGTDL